MQMVTKAKTCNLKKASEVYKLHPVPLSPSNAESEIAVKYPPTWSIAPKTELYLSIEFGCYTSLGVFLALLLRIQVFIASWVRKREASMTKLLAKYLTIVIVNVLHHPRYSSLFIFHNLRNDRRKLEVCLLALF